MPARPWGFWTEQKLAMLSAYLPKFVTASQRAGTTVYLDLFAGRAENESQFSGSPLEGSAIRALRTDPALSRLVFFELPYRAKALEAKLRAEFPSRSFTVYPGDCNDTIRKALAGLRDVRRMPTFAFIDQQGVELRWETLAALAAHKQGSPYKVEIWMLFAHAQLPRGLKVRDETDEGFARRVDGLLGEGWRVAYEARRNDQLSAESFRAELTNWMRWRLQTELRYKHTHAFELRNVDAGPVYSMVFATDNDAGNNIMSWLYAQAAERHPQMRKDAWQRREIEREKTRDQQGLFPPIAPMSTTDYSNLYVPGPPHPPFGMNN